MGKSWQESRHSLGSSWDSAVPSSDDEMNYPDSDPQDRPDLEDSEDDTTREHQDQPPRLPAESQRVSSHEALEQSNATPRVSTSQKLPVHSSGTTPRPRKVASSTPRSVEPSFIMPSMADQRTVPSTGSPMRQSQSQARKRTRRQSQLHNTSESRLTSRRPHRVQPPPQSGKQEELGPWHYVNLFYEHVALPLLAYVFEIFGYAMRHFVKPILGLMLGVGIIVFGMQLASSILYSKVTMALTPLCFIPGSSYVLPMCDTSQEENIPKFEELVDVQGGFEDILDASKETSTLPATLKDSEIAIRDLRTLVKHSRLPSRAQLDLEFHNFVETAKEASTDLSRYNTRIGTTIDRVISTNAWTLAVLQGIGEEEASRGIAGRVVSMMTGGFISPAPSLQQRVFDQYVLHVGRNKEEITRLIETAQALITVLNNLEQRLDTIYAITTNDDQTISRSQDELFASLWTKLGGNSATVKANQKQLNLLKNISGYRKKALVHVTNTLLKLQEIQSELESLREGVAAPEVLGYGSGIPVTYHIDLVEKGVERLRLARGESMRVEGETYRSRVRGSEGREGMLELPAMKDGPVVTARSK